MTNIDAVLQTYFVDLDINSVVESESKIDKHNSIRPFYKGLEESCFQDNFLKHNSMYGTDVISAVHTMAKDYWLKSNESNNVHIFNIPLVAAENFLLWQKDEPVCKYNDYLSWNDISSIVGEDLFTTAFLANKAARHNQKIDSFAWKPHITSDNTELSTVLNQGLSELHFHLYGSSLCFYLNWLALMNATAEEAKIRQSLFDISNEMYGIVEKARASRLYLFKVIQNQDTDKDRRKLYQILKSDKASINMSSRELCAGISAAKFDAFNYKGEYVDYALRNPITSQDIKRYYNVPLIGERKLLFELFKRIYSESESASKIFLPFHVYLLAKNKFSRFLLQNDGIKGFSHFSEIERRKFTFIPERSIYEKLFTFMAIHCTACNQPMTNLEMRISPKNCHQNQAQAIKEFGEIINSEVFRLNQPNLLESKVKAGYILHFIKRPDNKTTKSSSKDCTIYCRNQNLREKIAKQAASLAWLIRTNNRSVKGGISAEKYPIIGIDAASSEFGCRPEVFAPIFRWLKQIPRRTTLDYLYPKRDLQLGRTFHVGEDYYSIVDGLRAIDECITFLNFGNGDRLGHAVALGITPYGYYKTRNFRIVIPRQDLLDNAVWLIKKMDHYSIPDKGGIKLRLKNIFREQYLAIYNKKISDSIDDYYDAWLLRGDKPSPNMTSNEYIWKKHIRNNADPATNIARQNEAALEIYWKYHYDPQVRNKGNQITEQALENSDIDIIASIQEKMREEIAKKKIAIETNPTSNLRITDLDRYSKHPVLRFYNRDLVPNSTSYQINVSINTDDQGVFATSLEKEYTLLACALEKKRNEDGLPTYSAKDIYKWLDNIRKCAEMNSFIDNS